MPKKKSQSARQQPVRKSSRTVVLQIDGIDGNDKDNKATTSSDLEPPGTSVTEEIQPDDLNGPAVAVNDRCYLLEMTAEIRFKIWKNALTIDRPIRPRQLQSKSNKFYHQEAKDMKKSVGAQDPTMEVPGDKIVAPQLALTCHQIYDEVAGSGLFYHINEISFDDFKDMLTYLVAITPDRRNAIRSVSIKWSYSRYTKHALTMLATCEGLRHLKVENRFGSDWHQGQTIEGILWRHDNLAVIKGLETFEMVDITTLPLPHYNIITTEAELAALRALVAVTAQKLRALLVQPRVPVLLKMIREAEEFSGLNIYGDGRLGADKRPSIVASRTRGQLLKQKSLNDVGLLQETDEHPKFNAVGELLWDIKFVSGSRQLDDEQGSLRIELFVTWTDKDTLPTWEVLDDIVNTDNVLRIAGYYVKNPEAYDIKVATSTIKESMDKDDNRKVALDALSVVMKRNDTPDAGAQAKRLARSKMFRFN